MAAGRSILSDWLRLFGLGFRSLTVYDDRLTDAEIPRKVSEVETWLENVDRATADRAEEESPGLLQRIAAVLGHATVVAGAADPVLLSAGQANTTANTLDRLREALGNFEAGTVTRCPEPWIPVLGNGREDPSAPCGGSRRPAEITEASAIWSGASLSAGRRLRAKKARGSPAQPDDLSPCCWSSGAEAGSDAISLRARR